MNIEAIAKGLHALDLESYTLTEKINYLRDIPLDQIYPALYDKFKADIQNEFREKSHKQRINFFKEFASFYFVGEPEWLSEEAAVFHKWLTEEIGVII